MVFGRREAAEKARKRWDKLKRFVQTGAYLDDWSAPQSLMTVANAIRRMNSREKTMLSVGFETSRSNKILDTPRSCESSENKIIEHLQRELTKRDISLSSKSVSRPILMSSKHRPLNTSDLLRETTGTEFEYDEGEEVKLADLKSVTREKRRLVKTEDIYYAACSLCRVSPVSNFLKQCSTFKADLKNSFLSARDVKALSISLVRDNRICSLDVSGNEIGAIGVMYVAEMMVENNTIVELNLSGTIPGKEGLEALADLIKNNKTLRILRLEDNKIEHTEMEHIISIIENVPTLEEIHLGHNSLGFEGGNMLAKLIATNTTLKVLDLQWNQIRKDTAKSICKALADNQTLWSLNLSWNGLGKEGCIELAQSLKKNTKLADLNVSSNRIDMTSLRFLLHGLVQNKGIRYFQMGRNPITTEGAKAVIKAIQMSKHSRLESIQLEDISIDDQFLELMKELKESKSIRVTHGERIAGGNAVTEKDHDPHDLNRFDPVMVLVEYMRIDNLRLIDFFQYLDSSSREKLSKGNFRDGVATLGIPLTEHHLDIVMQKIDLKKDGYVDLEEFMTVHREVSRQITQRTTRAKSKKKEDEGLVGLRKILREIIEKRNKTNKEKAKIKLSLAAATRMLTSPRRFSVAGTHRIEADSSNANTRPTSSASIRVHTPISETPRDKSTPSRSTNARRPTTSRRGSFYRPVLNVRKRPSSSLNKNVTFSERNPSANITKEVPVA
ncbi:leucine-rich repeat-containing protein 74A-like isoform X2 [Mytilus californianus]|uniref:leucine-rich repeat-containing protein 74A-like isoform X2 n=1 Tax=Mytilus californianus TaxID=6549 RepID=UPI0022485458|nr:leucine-rich repeat-containing protein 74A-like isoform X2 [Mytilus californianus]XP_052078796.1 leucine-rich repeat-containing protein 74A-like isoform X2 [Mytilus californianus]